MKLKSGEKMSGKYPATLELLKQLCAIPAPSHNEERRAEFIKDYLTKAGAEGVYIDEALNVIYPVGVTEDNPVVLFIAHIDTVFPDTEPMLLSEHDGRMYCPGVGDDTANLSILLTVAESVARQKLQPAVEIDGKRVGVVLAGNSCEEGLGNLKGIRQLMNEYGKRALQVISFDATIGWVVDKPVGSERYEVSVTTEGGHSFADFGKPNAIANMAALIGDLYAVKVPVSGDSHTTYNVGAISGGTSVNTIAQRATMLYEYRSSDGGCQAKMRETFNGIIRARRNAGMDITVKLLGERPCNVDADPAKQSRLSSHAQAILFKHLGRKPSVSAGSTDCNIPLSQGVPSVCVGLYTGGGAHTREEWIIPDSLKLGLDVAADFILEWF